MELREGMKPRASMEGKKPQNEPIYDETSLSKNE
jgi:hypothetical protein